MEPTPVNGAVPRPVDVPSPRTPEPRPATHVPSHAAPAAAAAPPATAPPAAAAPATAPPAAGPPAAAPPVTSPPRTAPSATSPPAPPAPAPVVPAPRNPDQNTTGPDRSPQPAAGDASQGRADAPQGYRPTPDSPTQAGPTPVAELASSGPDTEPRRYADAELGNTWFATKKAAEPEPERSEPDEPEQHHGAETPAGVVLDLDITGLLSGFGVPAGAPDGEEPAHAAQEPAEQEAAEQEPAEQAATEQTATEQTADVRTPAEQTADEHKSEPVNADHPDAGTDWRTAARADDGTERPDPAPDAADRLVKPLSAADLEAIRWRLDGGTLREVVDDREALLELGDRLDGPLSEDQDTVTRAGLLSVRAEVYRLLGELGMAAAASRLALVHAETSGDVQSIVIAQAELAHVLRLRGDFAEADRLFEEAASSEAPEALRSVVHENAGRCCFDQGRHMEALDHFARAVRLGPLDDTELVERIDVCLEAVYIHVLRDGWGPYPRLRREILGPPRAPRRESAARS